MPEADYGAGSSVSSFDNNSDTFGRRARLRPKPAAMQQILGSGGILAPLWQTNGMVWPYQPSINFQQDVTYQDVSMVHTNQEFYAYTRTNAIKFSIEGDFTVQNQTEGRYTLACIHFLRTVTKMWFGQGPNIGTPPPVLLFDAFGQYMFNRLPVIVTSFSANMPKEVDYVPINIGDLGKTDAANISFTTPNKIDFSGAGYVWLPAMFTISVSLTVQNTPAKLRQFNLNEFRNGNNMGGWI